MFPTVILSTLALMLGSGPEIQADPDPMHILGGEEVSACGWPSVARIAPPGGGVCSAVLVHPRVIMTAAHCLDEGLEPFVTFGEDIETGPELAEIIDCQMFPTWSIGAGADVDFGYCILAEPVTSVPIIPVAGGCEQTAIIPGARVMQVGFGIDDMGEVGHKRMLETVIAEVTPQSVLIVNEPSGTICAGDSGGPTFVYLDPARGGDGSWRVAGIHSWGEVLEPGTFSCIGMSGSGIVSLAIGWVEEETGFDITPCTDGDRWSPTFHCGGIPTEPWVGSGDYEVECTSPQEVEFAEICGASFDSVPDATAPIVEIVSPQQGQNIPPGEGDTTVEVLATDEGWGVATVEVTVRSQTDGSEQHLARNEWQPWTWAFRLPAGSYEVEAVATDHAGNVSPPGLLCFGIGEPGCESVDLDGTGSTTEGSTGDELPGGTAGESAETGGEPGAADDGSGQGCGCRAATGDRPNAPAPLALLPLFLAARRRSRCSANR